MKPYKILLSIALLVSVAMYAVSCSEKEDETKLTTDEELYNMATQLTSSTWFGKSDALLNKSSGSGHTEPFLRVKYNSIAAAKLDANGRVTAGTIFPDGSLIVKELMTDAQTINGYAIMYKKAGHIHADANGWVWGYLDKAGAVKLSASTKGSGCTSCHGESGNIDYTLMNKAFPVAR